MRDRSHTQPRFEAGRGARAQARAHESAARAPRPRRRGDLDPRPRPRRLRAPAPRDHRPRDRPAADARRRRQLDHLQRRDLQLRRAAPRARRGQLPHDVRHRGRAPRVPALGAGVRRAAARACSRSPSGTKRRSSSSARATASASSRSPTPSTTASSTPPPRRRRSSRSCRRSRPTSSALKDYLAFQFCLAGKTLFKGVRELLPGPHAHDPQGRRARAALLGGRVRAGLRPPRGLADGAPARARRGVGATSTFAPTCRSAPTSPAASTRASRPRSPRRPSGRSSRRSPAGSPRGERYDETRYARLLAGAARLPAARGDDRRRRLRREHPRRRLPPRLPGRRAGLVPAVHGLAARGPAHEGRARRPGRRRDLRRLRALPARLLRAVHQGRDRRDDARRQLRRHVRVDHPAARDAARVQAADAAVLARRASSATSTRATSG